MLVLGACGPAGSERAAPPASQAAASETPAAAAPAAVVVPAGDSVEGLVQAFARGDIADVGGDASLRAWVREFVVGLKGGDEPVEVAFVVDRSLNQNAAQALALAAAGARPEFPLLKKGRAGLVSYAAGGGAWVTRVEAPLAEGLPGVIGAAMRVEWAPDGGAGIVGGWAGLAEATRLEWRAPPGRRHVVLLLDDRSADGLRLNPWPADDPALRTKVAAWGRDAVLHVVRSRLELADGRGWGPEAPPDPGVPPAVIAGLVRNGRHTGADAPGPMIAAVSGGLEALAGGPADVAIVVDRIGTDLAGLRPAIDRFMAGPEHRLALLRWDAADVEVLSGLTGDASVAVRALGKLRAVRPETRPRPVFTALAAAQGLAWQPAARKVVIVLTAAPARLTAEAAAVLAWTEAAAVTVLVVELAPGGATASAPKP